MKSVYHPDIDLIVIVDNKQASVMLESLVKYMCDKSCCATCGYEVFAHHIGYIGDAFSTVVMECELPNQTGTVQ
jgi:hypothetical protein